MRHVDGMSYEEEIAHIFLRSLGLGPVEFEPLGRKRVPDFSVNGNSIGIEVRRLNRCYVSSGGKARGFEDAEYEVLDPLRSMLEEFGAAGADGCWRVSVRFKRPVQWKSLRKTVRLELTKFKLMEARTDAVLTISAGLELELTHASNSDGPFFRLWIIEDTDVGGAPLAHVEESLRICIPEKGSKIAPVRGMFNEWWLVLINYVDKNMNVVDYETFTIQPSIEHGFDKVILIDPVNYRNWIQVAC